MSSVINVSQVHYPESDGKPMGETDLHRDQMVRHIELLKHYYRNQRVYVSGDLLVYYEQGNPKRFIVPDAFVAKGINPKRRRIYKIWFEGKPPDVIIETTSKKTKRKDTIDKPRLYAQLGVKEYFMVDPEQDYLDPALQGYRLVGSIYRRIVADETGSLVSEELGLKLRLEDDGLVFYRLDTGERLLTADERADRESEGRRAEAEARRAEAEGRRAAESELARLREEVAKRPKA